jgi:hypothetical protein
VTRTERVITDLRIRLGQWPDNPKNHPCPDCSALAGEACSLNGPGWAGPSYVHIRRCFVRLRS